MAQTAEKRINPQDPAARLSELIAHALRRDTGLGFRTRDPRPLSVRIFRPARRPEFGHMQILTPRVLHEQPSDPASFVLGFGFPMVIGAALPRVGPEQTSFGEFTFTSNMPLIHVIAKAANDGSVNFGIYMEYQLLPEMAAAQGRQPRAISKEIVSAINWALPTIWKEYERSSTRSAFLNEPFDPGKFWPVFNASEPGTVVSFPGRQAGPELPDSAGSQKA